MNKKNIIFMVAIAIVAIIITVLINIMHQRISNNAYITESIVDETTETHVTYDLNKSPKEYNIDIKENEEEYLAFIKENLYPEKLRNFVEFNRQHLDTISGDGVLDWMEFEAFNRMFYCFFIKDYVGFSECPVTENFKVKFNEGLYKFF